MLFLQQLSVLDPHQIFLQKKMKNQHLFLVGGCVRDLILGITKKVSDIDFTMGGNPEALYKNIDTTNLSHFMTEKFGTITLIPKEKKDEDEIKYELTPLRTEGDYGDFRHPGEIQRSNNIILDSQRRDFSINAMYYFSTDLGKKKHPSTFGVKEKREIGLFEMEKLLEKEGYLYLHNINLLILQKHQYIDQIFGNAKFDFDYYSYLVETQKEELLFGGKPKINKDTKSRIRVLIDPQQGLIDCAEKKIKTVGEADKRFGEDALRLIRAIRILNVCNQKLLELGKKQKRKGFDLDGKIQLFDFENETWNSIMKNADLLGHVAKERIKEEISKAFRVGNPFNFVSLLESAGLLKLLFPAVDALKGVDQPMRYHPFDTYAHTLLTLFELQKINTNPLVRLAMLYHDTGKKKQYEAFLAAETKEEKRKVLAGPLNHRTSGPEIAKADFSALGFSRKEIEEICRYISEHHTPGEILSAHPDNREKKVRKLLSEAGYERVQNVFDINIADRLGQYNPLQNSSDISDSYYLKILLDQLLEKEGQFTAKDLAVKGGEILEHFQIEAGPLVGELLEKALNWVLNDIEERNNEELIFDYLENYLKGKKE